MERLNDEARRNQPGGSHPNERGRDIDYLISEIDESSSLLHAYVYRWRAFVSPCRYEQPAAQGLAPRKMKLVLQPVARLREPTAAETVRIVREIYRRVYRLSDVEQNAYFRRVVESVGGYALN